MRVILFGTGSVSEKVLSRIVPGTEVVAVTDNNPQKWGGIWNDLRIINPVDISKYEYDYVLVCSMYTKEIINGLLQKGLNRERIVPYFDNYYTDQDKKKEAEIRNILISPDEEKLQKSNRVALLTRRNSGCNCRALNRNIPDSAKEKYTITLIGLEDYKSFWKEFDTVFTTNIEGRSFKNRLNIEMWHGFPLKTLGNLEKNLTDNIRRVNATTDYIISYSSLYSYVMASAYNIDVNKFVITGMPRNDLLINREARKLTNQIAKKNLDDHKVLFYMPTFRRRIDKSSREGENIFSCEDEFRILDEQLGDMKCILIVKKHPVEGDDYNQNHFRNIIYISDDDLKLMDIDLYEILGGSDMLITDYSSVYFDYLLINKPIAFWHMDKEAYENNRGFLFSNIDQMMPGPKARTASELMQVIKNFFANPSWYAQERTTIRDMVHHYQDFNSSERVWKLLDQVH